MRRLRLALAVAVILIVAACNILTFSANRRSGDSVAEGEQSSTQQRSSGVLHGKTEGNPADHPGVTVYEPTHDDWFRYLPETGQVLDTTNGDKLAMRSVHGDSPAHYALVNSSNKPLVQGSYFVSGLTLRDGSRATIYDIVSTFMREPGTTKVKPIDFDVGRLAAFIKVRADSARPNNPLRVIVADSRRARGKLP